MTWLNLRADIRAEFAAFGACSGLECYLSRFVVWSQDKRNARKRRYARSEKGRAAQRARRATPEGRRKHCAQEKARKAKKRV